MPHPVIEAAERFRDAARRREAEQTTALVRAYGRVYARLTPQITALEEAVRGLDTPRPADIARLSSLRVLRAQVEQEVNRYAQAADRRIVQDVRASMEAGLADSRDLVLAHFDPAWMRANGLRMGDAAAQIRAGWTRLPLESVETMAGMTAEGSPLRRTLVDRLGAEVAQRVADALVEGIALGKNPRTLWRESMAQGLDWSLTTARTAQLYAYRQATRANYQANRDVVAGWRWKATFDGRTCVSCLAMHGTRHGVDDVLNDHHQGRCTAIPDVPLARQMGIPEPDLKDAEAWLRGRSEEQQRAQMGRGVWEEWRAGRVGLKDLTTTYEDPVYGTMRRAVTLAMIAGERGTP